MKEGSGETSANGAFAVVTMKGKAMTAVATDQPAPSDDGWKWIAPDGESIGVDSGNSTSGVMDKYNNADDVQPGTYQWRSQDFDLTPAQAQDGTLLYADGNGVALRWKMSAADSTTTPRRGGFRHDRSVTVTQREVGRRAPSGASWRPSTRQAARFGDARAGDQAALVAAVGAVHAD